MGALIISAYPGCGKSTYYSMWSMYSENNVWRIHKGEPAYCVEKTDKFAGDKIIDSDSSYYSWTTTGTSGNKIRNPDFPNNYVQRIMEFTKTEDIIFVSSHDIVRAALSANHIPYVLVYPERCLKSIYIENYKSRGNSAEFIKNQFDNWDAYHTSMESDPTPFKYVLNMRESSPYITTSVIMEIKQMIRGKELEEIIL